MSYNNANPNADNITNNPLSDQSPIGVPDILTIGQPLDRVVDVEIETNLLDPVSHNFTSAGGRTTWVFPAKGVLDNRNAAVVFELNGGGANFEYAYPFSVGGLACIERCTLRCGGNIISQVDGSNLYSMVKSKFKYSADEQVGILDVRHKSSSEVKNRIAPATLATGSGDQSFHQLYNPTCDQPNSFGKGYNALAANGHLPQQNKCLVTTANAGTGPEVVIRLRDIFEFFDQPNRLPLFAMAQVELEIEWASGGTAGVTGNDINDSVVIQAGQSGEPDAGIPSTPALRNVAGVIGMNGTPTLMLDYILYDEPERAQIQAVINSPQGMNLSFIETIRTKGVSPQASAATIAAAAGTTEVINSNHILGMAGKEVHSMCVLKSYDVKSGQGLTERASVTNGVNTHLNVLLNQFKSQQMIGEKYNFIINNNRLYDKDVDNAAVQYNYLTQVGGNYNTVGAYYNTMNYNADKCKELLDASWNGKAAVATDGVGGGVNGRTKRYLAGSNHVIGLSLEKMRGIGPVPGNGQRISTAPIEFNYSRVAVKQNGAADDLCGAVDLTFYINYRKSLTIQANGVSVNDA